MRHVIVGKGICGMEAARSGGELLPSARPQIVPRHVARIRPGRAPPRGTHQRTDRPAPWSSHAVAPPLRHLVCPAAAPSALILVCEQLEA